MSYFHCIHCGTDIESTYKFNICPNCNRPINRIVINPTVTPLTPAPSAVPAQPAVALVSPVSPEHKPLIGSSTSPSPTPTVSPASPLPLALNQHSIQLEPNYATLAQIADKVNQLIAFCDSANERIFTLEANLLNLQQQNLT